MRKGFLKQLHQAHMGIERAKWIARATIFWPQINQQIEEIVKICSNCLHNQRKQSREAMIPSDVPRYPFQTVGTDLFHWNGQKTFYWLWIITADIWKLRNYIRHVATTIKKTKNVFSRKGIPEIVISDNSPQYHSREFKKFPKDWGFQHVKRSSEYPISNGLAEKIVQTAKKLLEKTKVNNKDQPNLLAEDNFDQFYQLIQTI